MYTFRTNKGDLVGVNPDHVTSVEEDAMNGEGCSLITTSDGRIFTTLETLPEVVRGLESDKRKK